MNHHIREGRTRRKRSSVLLFITRMTERGAGGGEVVNPEASVKTV